MHLSANIGTGKAPMDATSLLIALARQGQHMLPQPIETLDALGQAAAFKNADLDLSHIEPGQPAWKPARHSDDRLQPDRRTHRGG